MKTVDVAKRFQDRGFKVDFWFIANLCREYPLLPPKKKVNGQWSWGSLDIERLEFVLGQIGKFPAKNVDKEIDLVR